jgi:CRP-like cAMP-binding protein
VSRHTVAESGFALSRTRLLQDVSRERLELLARECTWFRYDRGAEIIAQQATGREVFFITSGAVRVRSYSTARRQVSFRDVEAGAIVGDIAAVDGGPRSTDVTALVESVLAALPAVDFMRLLREQPVVHERYLRYLTGRESLAIHVGQSLKGDDVVRVLNAIVQERGQPQTIKTDNGSEFISKVMDKWAYERGVELDFSRPGKPTDNAMVESFNGRLRQECLNEHWFMSLAAAQDKIDAWRRFYNEARPHGALDWRTPIEFARQTGLRPGPSNIQEPEILTSER